MPLQKTPVRIYRDEKTGKTGVQTTCATAEEFISELAEQLNDVVALLQDADALDRWLRQSFEIVAKLKGYKADVQEERTIYAGDSFVGEEAELTARIKLETVAS